MNFRNYGEERTSEVGIPLPTQHGHFSFIAAGTKLPKGGGAPSCRKI
jgi:hypothetical protein